MKIWTIFALILLEAIVSATARPQDDVVVEVETSSTTTAASTTKDNSGCPLHCPVGWNYAGPFSYHCYYTPPQPAKRTSFWEYQRICKNLQPTSYVAVVNSFFEQMTLTPVALQYAANWLAALGAGFLWIGGYNDGKKWNFVDGCPDCTQTALFALASVGGNVNNTCLGADIKTFGAWQTYDCNDQTGVAFCEMAPIPMCEGPYGGTLPIAPIDFSIEALKNLFPKWPSLPYANQLFSGFSLSNTLSNIKETISCWFGWCKASSTSTSATPPPAIPEGCRWDCPVGWVSWDKGPTGSCYLLPDFKAPKPLSFWEAEAQCRKYGNTSHISMIAGYIEQAGTSALLKHYGPDWQKALSSVPDVFLWLGAYTDSNRWNLVDGGDATSILQMAMANLPSRRDGSFKNGTCLKADLTTGGNWQQVPCSQKKGLAICEMPKKTVCDKKPGGDLITKVTPDWMTLDEFKELFPNSIEIPYLAEYIGMPAQTTNYTEFAAAQKQNMGDKPIGNDQIKVNCMSYPPPAGYWRTHPEPSWNELWIGNKAAVVTGKWEKFNCKGTYWGFRVTPLTYLSVWTRCYNKGYVAVQPTNGDGIVAGIGNFIHSTGWDPFLVNNNHTQYYWKWGSYPFDSYPLVSAKNLDDC